MVCEHDYVIKFGVYYCQNCGMEYNPPYKMTHEEKINYMRIATNLCRFGFEYGQLDLLVMLYEVVIEKGGDVTIKDVSTIEADVKDRCREKKKQELADKISNTPNSSSSESSTS